MVRCQGCAERARSAAYRGTRFVEFSLCHLHSRENQARFPDICASLRVAREVLEFGRRWCARHGVPAPEFTLGGGMAVDYDRPEERFDWAGYGQGLATLSLPGERLRIEPGRAVTAYCGWYLTRVLDVKTSHGRAFAVVAGGTHHLRTPAAKGHSQPCAVIPGPAGAAVAATGAITGATVNATYQDVAEWVPSTQKLQAGTVVVLDKSETNHVLASTRAYDTKVAGVVSAQPGISLGQGGDGKLLVATTGRVKVRVDATRAPIKVGDLLVTSDVEGVAMKSVEVDLGGVKIHRPGTIIGKALEPLASGTGEILVLLSLQ